MATQDVRMRSEGGHRILRQETRRPVEVVLVNIVYFVFGVIIALLAMRFVLLLLGANPDAGFSQLIYALSAPLMAPFFAVFGRTVIEGAVFEWSALLAIAVYALIAWGIASLITAVTPRASAGTVETYEEAHDDVADQSARDYDAGDTYVEDDRRVHRGGGPVVHH